MALVNRSETYMIRPNPKYPSTMTVLVCFLFWSAGGVSEKCIG
jgi:hypothetical protein